ncbi:MAG: hypothetical protein DRG78_19950 [Epsilonproteobacteria bacterium]|nr:MAG: hypothetical protein DRG78_19950 [Campylobacterota bacterium]
MNKRILISTVFISNIIFASVLPSQINQINLNKNRLGAFSTLVSFHLYKRGLDKHIAIKKVSESLIGEDFENELMIQNILAQLDIVEYESIINYIADSVLHARAVDLSSYGTIVGMVQKISKLRLDKENLKKIEKISLENTKIKQLHSA